MKKLLTLTAILAMSASAFAGFQSEKAATYGNKSGQTMSQKQQKRNATIVTVAQAKQLKYDTFVRMSGYITAAHGDEKYTFKDSTGTMLVEIDDKVWRGLNVNEKTKVRIGGKIDRDDGRVTVDVKRISKAK